MFRVQKWVAGMKLMKWAEANVCIRFHGLKCCQLPPVQERLLLQMAQFSHHTIAIHQGHIFTAPWRVRNIAPPPPSSFAWWCRCCVLNQGATRWGTRVHTAADNLVPHSLGSIVYIFYAVMKFSRSIMFVYLGDDKFGCEGGTIIKVCLYKKKSQL